MEMDERRNALVRTLRDRMNREADLFGELSREVECLRESFQRKDWAPSLAITEGIGRFARAIEEADAARDEQFESLRDALDLPRETTMSGILPRVPDGERAELEESWRALRMSVLRLKTATGRLRYSAETLADTLNKVLEEVFPYRKGKIYSRKGTPTSVGGAVLVDRKL
jgi:hypothetical protein